MESLGGMVQLQGGWARGQVAAEHIDSYLPGAIGLTAIDQHVFAGLADQFPSMAANRQGVAANPVAEAADDVKRSGRPNHVAGSALDHLAKQLSDLAAAPHER